MRRLLTVLLPLFLLFATCCTTGTVAVRAAIPFAPNSSFPGEFTINKPDPVSQKRTVYVYMDSRLTGSTTSEIFVALAEWNYVLNGYITYKVANSNWIYDDKFEEHISDVKEDLIFKRVDIEDEDDIGKLGQADGIPGNVVSIYEETAAHWSISTIMLHEIGHTLGLSHLPIKGTLMYPYIQGQSPCVDEIAVRELVSVNDFMNFDHLNYCKSE